jgi:CDP-L-myo-inositol myo-inositolphosphotransferase
MPQEMPASKIGLSAIILAAGEGKRLSGTSGVPKPLRRLLGLTLLERAVLSCKAAGVTQVYVAVGFKKEEIRAHLKDLQQKHQISIEAIDNSHWPEGNGTSVLACAGHTNSPFLVLMADHLIDPEAISQLIRRDQDKDSCYLLVDYRIDQVFDRNDATRVKVDNKHITDIGKHLKLYNAIDTGVFLCQPFLFQALNEARLEGDGTLAGGTGRLAKLGKMKAIDIKDRFWLDIDTPQALQYGRSQLLKRARKNEEDGYVAKLLNRRVSIGISKLILENPTTASINPTTISIISFLIILIGSALFLLRGSVASIVAGVLIQFGSILDGTDGELARLTFRTSPFGAWLDTLLDRYGDMAVAIGVTLRFWMKHPTGWIVLGGMGALAGFLLASYTKKEFTLRYGKGVPNSAWTNLVKRDLRLFAVFIGAIAGFPYFALLFVGLLSHIGIARLVYGVRKSTRAS